MKLTPDEQRVMALEIAVRTLAANAILQHGDASRLREMLDMQLPKIDERVIPHPRYPASDIAALRTLAEAYLILAPADDAR